MSTSLRPTARAAHPTVLSDGERHSLAGEIRQSLLSLASRSKDKRVQQLRKSIDRGDNRVADTTAAILADAHNSRRENPEDLLSTISGFFSVRTKKLQRKLQDLMQVETIAEGEFEPLQMRIAQGDVSRPTLVAFKKELREYRAVLDEMELAVDGELYRTEVRS
jgi:hypothetical protein